MAVTFLNAFFFCLLRTFGPANGSHVLLFISSSPMPLSFLVCLAVKPATCVSELAEFYRDSCTHHNAEPIESIMKHLDTLDLNSHTRRPILNLREQNLTAESCEALEEVLKRVSFIFERTQSHTLVVRK